MGKGENDERCGCCKRYTLRCLLKVIFCCLILFVLVLLSLGIAEIVIEIEIVSIGIWCIPVRRHLHSRLQLERMVPIYLIASGCGALLLLIGLVIRGSDDDKGLPCRDIWCMIGWLFNLAWLICGTVWVYPTYAAINKDTYVPCHDVNGTLGPPECTEGTCNDTLLKISVAMVTLNWICIGMWSVVIGIMINDCAKSSQRQSNKSDNYHVFN